jgi:hypothetical protein
LEKFLVLFLYETCEKIGRWLKFPSFVTF